MKKRSGLSFIEMVLCLILLSIMAVGILRQARLMQDVASAENDYMTYEAFAVLKADLTSEVQLAKAITVAPSRLVLKYDTKIIDYEILKDGLYKNSEKVCGLSSGFFEGTTTVVRIVLKDGDNEINIRLKGGDHETG